MPYIAIKSFPKDGETKKRVIEKIEEVFVNEWGCPPEAVTISLEEFAPEKWGEVVENEIRPNMDNVVILDGKVRG